MFRESKYGHQQIIYNDYVFNRHVVRDELIYWRCSQFAVFRCKARIKTNKENMTVLNGVHNHEVIKGQRQYGALKEIKRQQRLAQGLPEVRTPREAKRDQQLTTSSAKNSEAKKDIRK